MKVKGSWYVSYTCYDFYNYSNFGNVTEIDSYKHVVKYLEVWHKIRTWERVILYHCLMPILKNLNRDIYNIQENESLLLIDR
jgi:hypothetical protein